MTDPFPTPTSVFVGGKVITDSFGPKISLDGQTLYGIDGPTLHLWQATRTSTPAIFGPKQEIFTSADFLSGVVSADGLTLYLTDPAGTETYVVTRTLSTLAFTDTPQRVDILNVAGKATGPEWISEDDCVLYLTSNRGGPGAKGGSDIFISTRGQ